MRMVLLVREAEQAPARCDCSTGVCMSFDLVVGYGPAGVTTARLLADTGHRVKVATRSGRPSEPGIEHVALGTTAWSLVDVAKGATAIYNCACPPYQRWTNDWPALAASLTDAAESSGAVLVLLSNLYGYGIVDGEMTEDLPLTARGAKGRVRAEVWRQALDRHRQGRLRVVEARASDFFGPGVVDGGHLASRVIPVLLRHRPIRVLGDPDAPHSWTYLPDVARTLVTLARTEHAWGRPWHVPTVEPESIRVMVDRIARCAGVRPTPVRQIPGIAFQTMALFSSFLRELHEIRYQFDRPFAVNSSAYTSQFGERPTPVEDQVQATVEWWLRRIEVTG